VRAALRDSLLGWLRGFFGGTRRKDTASKLQSGAPGIDAGNGEPPFLVRDAGKNRPEHVAGDPGEAQAYLRRVRAKLDRLAEDFNKGTINRAQFQHLYAHYQREIRTVEGMMEIWPDSETWKGAVTEGESVIIRQQHVARAEGYAIFENNSGMPVSTLGRFELDPALLVPMLSSYRAATKEIFGSGTRSTEIEDGRWLCFVPGKFTTMLSVFSNEPATKQLAYLEELHRHFERANRRHLANPPLNAKDLLFPHQYFLGEWRRQ
jgi:hypothetical protein